LIISEERSMKRLAPYTFGKTHAAIVVAEMLSGKYPGHQMSVSRMWQAYTTILSDIVDSNMCLKAKKTLIYLVLKHYQDLMKEKENMPHDLCTHIMNMLVAYFNGIKKKIYGD